MKFFRIPGDESPGAQIVAADRLDEQIIERKHAQQSKKGEKSIVEHLEQPITRASIMYHKTDFSFPLKDAFAAHLFGQTVDQEQQHDAD